MAAPAAVCICLQSACESGVVDEGRLLELAPAAGLKVRRVAAAVADLMVSKAGANLAFLLWRQEGSSGGGGGSAPNAGAPGSPATRIERLAGAFKQAYVLVPHELMGSQAVLDAMSRFACEESLNFVFMPIGAAFIERALSLAAALLPAESGLALWRQQQCEVVTTSDAVNQALLGLPLPADGDAAHHANMLRMLGSLQHISQKRGDEIAAHTDLDRRTADSIAAFFQRGARHSAPPGLRMAPQLQTL